MSNLSKKRKTLKVKERLVRGGFASAAGVISQQISLTPANLLNATVTAGYQAIFEEARLLKATFKLTVDQAYCAGGVHVFYIDRDPADAIVLNIGSAFVEQESVFGNFTRDLRLVWTPRDPQDREYQLWTAFSAPATINYLAAAVTTATAFNAYIEVLTEWEFRGRDF